MDSYGWDDYETCWHYLAPQISPEWHNVKKYRMGGSIAGMACELANKKFSTREELLSEMIGLTKKEFNPQQLSNIRKGQLWEPKISKMYQDRTGNVVEEYGFCIWKKDPRIGVSVDGVSSFVNNLGITDTGIIEIKTAVNGMYRPLLNFRGKSDSLYSHIWRTHYTQMQMGMKILDKKWADYIVYSPNDDKLFMQRIPFNEKFWNEIVEPGIIAFMDELDQTMYDMEIEFQRIMPE